MTAFQPALSEHCFASDPCELTVMGSPHWNSPIHALLLYLLIVSKHNLMFGLQQNHTDSL